MDPHSLSVGLSTFLAIVLKKLGPRLHRIERFTQPKAIRLSSYSYLRQLLSHCDRNFKTLEGNQNVYEFSQILGRL